MAVSDYDGSDRSQHSGDDSGSYTQTDRSSERSYRSGSDSEDLEKGSFKSSLSSSIDVPDDFKITFVEGKNLINNCSFCHKPLKKFAANLEGPYVLLYLFVCGWAPYFVRLSMHTSYIHFTESEPSMRGDPAYKFLFALGFLGALMLLSGSIVESISDALNKKRSRARTSTSEDDSEVELYKGNVVLFKSKNGRVWWTTKNNILATMRPTSVFKWFKNSTIVEKLVHILVSLRWAVSSSYIVLIYLIAGIVSIVPAAGVNDSNFYLFQMHCLNGMAYPLCFFFGIKLLYRVSKLVVKQFARKFFKMDEEETSRLTENGKTLTHTPFLTFFTDKCPCNYAVTEDSKLPTQYRYSLRYHTLISGGFKTTCLSLCVLMGLFVFVLSTFSFFTKATMRTIR